VTFYPRTDWDYWCFDHDCIHTVRLADPMPRCNMVWPVPEDKRVVREAERIVADAREDGSK